MPAPGRIASAIAVACAALQLSAQTAPLRRPALEPPRQLVRKVIYNELHDSERDSRWEYLSHQITSSHNIVREQIETRQGPVFRILERNGQPLDSSEQSAEDERLAGYIHDPDAVAHVLRDHEEDQARLATIMRMLPQAFLYTWDGPPQGDIGRLSFRPDPAFQPDGYEARIVHDLSGTLTVNLRLRRMIDIQGTLAQRIDFGYGFLGHVDQGGRFEIHRVQVSPTHWKTDLVDVHVEGKILMLKTVSKDERETRSEFRPVPADTTLAEARTMLAQSPPLTAEQNWTSPGTTPVAMNR